MKTLTLTIEDFKGLELPALQKDFLDQFDGSIESILNFSAINIVLNPTYTGHYFYVSGNSDENTVTTKSTDGSYAMNGKQSKLAEENSYLLARRVREFISTFELKKGIEIFKTDDEMRKFGSKVDRVKKYTFVKTNDGVFRRVVGF